VQGIIAARLDALAPEEKALLQDAAVIGKVFWLGALGATEQQLHVLRQKEFVQRARRSSVEGEVEFAFKHVLVRDVAYGQIPRAERAEKHLRAAGWIESLGRAEDHAEMVAHHYVNGLELARAAGQDITELAARAVRALCEAGERALALNALTPAADYFRQAVALAPDDPELLLAYGRVLHLQDASGEPELTKARGALLAEGKREAAAEATLLLADVAWNEGRRNEVDAYLEEARSLVAELPASRAQTAVLSEVARFEMLAGRIDAAFELAEEALATADELGLPVGLRLRLMNTVAISRGDMGDPAAFAEMEQVIQLATASNQINELLRAWNNVTALHILHGSLAKTQAGEAETLRLAEHYGQRGIARFIETGAAFGNRFHAGQWDDSLARTEQVIADIEHGGRRYQSSAAYAFRGLIRLARGEEEGLDSDAELAVEGARRVADTQAFNPDLAMASFIFASVDNKQRAGETVTEALANLRSLQHLGFGVMEAPLLAWTALTLGREAEVVEVLEAEVFKSPWLRSALAVASRDFHSAGDILGDAGFRAYEAFFRLQAGGEEDVRRALAFYRSVGATRYLREGEALLAPTA
jgi:tetratricopeptide (TPR) repeat protein